MCVTSLLVFLSCGDFKYNFSVSYKNTSIPDYPLSLIFFYFFILGSLKKDIMKIAATQVRLLKKNTVL